MEDERWLQLHIVAAAIVTLTALWLALLMIGRGKSSPVGPRYPPGPRGWPVFGSLLSLGKLPHRDLLRLSTRYGPLMFMRFGSVPTLVVSNAQMAKEILKTHDQIMASRPKVIVGGYVTYGGKDVAYAPYGPHWRNVRRVCTQELFTAARLNQFQGMREREVLAVLHAILEASQQGHLLSMNKVFSSLTTNNITQMLLNKSYCVATGGSSSAEGTAFQEVVKEMFELLGAVNISDYIPVLRPLDLQGFDKRMKAVRDRMAVVLDNVIEEHRKQEPSTGTQEKMNEDFLDVLLKLPKDAESEEPLPIDTIKAILTDLLNAGAETSATMSEWTLSELMRHPSIMRRVQDELNSVIGPERLVKETDIPDLKYLQAVIKEAFRVHPPAPMSVPHESTHDCQVAGYHIPAGTQVFINVWAIQRDPTVFERPLEFDPDRFLNSPIDVKGRDFELIPFGSGRRMCPATNLGLLLVQYTLAQMLHAISWSLPGDQKPQELDMIETFGLACPRAVPLKLLAKPRLPAHVIYPALP